MNRTFCREYGSEIIAEGKVIAEGEVKLLKTQLNPYEAELVGVVLKCRNREIPLNDILTEEQAIEYEGKKMQIIIRR